MQEKSRMLTAQQMAQNSKEFAVLLGVEVGKAMSEELQNVSPIHDLDIPLIVAATWMLRDILLDACTAEQAKDVKKILKICKGTGTYVMTKRAVGGDDDNV